MLRRGGPHLAAQKENAVAPEPRIYVACLASYNAGRLFGSWLPVPEDAAALESEIHSLLKKSPSPGAEEWAIHDYEGFGELSVGEYTSSAELIELARFVRTHGRLGTALVRRLGSLDEARARLEHDYCGAFASLEAWAEMHLEETGLMARVPETLRPYLNLTRYARGLEAGGALMTLRGEATLHVFWTR